MADILAIAEQTRQIVRARGARDPYEIAEREGVRVCRYDLGSLNGMYIVIDGISFIAISSCLEEEEARLVCAHELGHHFLHKCLAESSALSDSSLFSGGGRLEYEANVFAAELLVCDRELLDAARSCRELVGAANELGVCPELLSVKSEILRKRGLELNPMEIEPDFLRKKLHKKY
ncbi:MAG: ImmA/IrrE family metallo-endopeptidase [Clostridia bacterium]|nr:ImmA/IrrE family metallo-endopeptidase [Clostridia bacterium]